MVAELLPFVDGWIFGDAGGGNTILAAPFLVLGRRFEKDVNDEDLNGELGLAVMQLEKVMEMKTLMGV